MAYATQIGLLTEDEYPYVGEAGLCRSVEGAETMQLERFDWALSYDPEELTTALQKGPVAAAIDGTSDMVRFHKGGTVIHAECGDSLNHGVLVVGYGEDYWLIQSAWGE